MSTRALSAFPDLPGARESNAGDDFHILWALSRCLKLIDPASDLSMVVIEDVSPIDRAGAAPRDFLTADVTQYYGGESFGSAQRVEIAQLKYSHRHPDIAWTAARLAPRKLEPSKSTLGKLAAASRRLAGEHGHDAVLARLSLQLVSNQPSSSLLKETLRLSKAAFSEDRPPRTMAALSSRLPTRRHRLELARLYAGSGLKAREFMVFVQVLSVDETGIEDRFGQQARIVRTLDRHVLGSTDRELHGLYMLIHQQAMPESFAGLKRSDILARLGFSEWDSPPEAETITRPHVMVDQPAARDLALLVESADSRKVLAHGAAGVGKSTTILQLQSRLPAGSTVVIFDCFAGGSYRTPGKRRHAPLTAIHEIINQLAVSCGTPFLVKHSGNEEALWRRLGSVLADISGELGPAGAHLVIAIDAADNSVVAARERGERSFVHDLWTIDLPPNVHIVMTCRTGRRGLLHLPTDVEQLELRGFDATGSTAHLRLRFPDARDDVGEKFHERSSGNPRAQAYVLGPDQAGRIVDADACAELVTPTPNNQFDSLIETATDARPDDAEEWLAILAAMQPPVRLESLAKVLGAGLPNVDEFCKALEPGVRIDHEMVSFRDEDFEAYVRERFDEHSMRSAHAAIARGLYPLREQEAWAAAELAEHLAAAGDASATLDLALSDGSPAAIADPAARTRVHLRRVALALQTDPPPSRGQACRLVALASQLRRTNDAIGLLVREHPDLALRFADPLEVARAHAEDIASADGWDGPAHFRLAVIAAEAGDVETAERRLELGEAWVRRYLDEREDHERWRFNAEHAAIAAEAVYRLSGNKAAASWIRRWRPPSFAESVATKLVERLIAARFTDGLVSHITEARLRPKLEAKLLASLYSGGVVASPSQVRRVADALMASPPHVDRDDLGWLVDFFELAVTAPIGRKRVLALLAALGPKDVGYAPSRHDLGGWREVLRTACLEAAIRGRTLKVADLVPQRLNSAPRVEESTKEARRRNEERDRLERALSGNLGDFRFRAEALAGVGTDTLPARAHELMNGLIPNREHHYRSEDWLNRFHRTATRTVEAVLHGGASPTPLVEVALGVTDEDGRRPTEVWLAVARLLLRNPTHVRLGLDLVQRVASETVAHDEPLSEKTDRLVRCSALCRGVDDELASECFDSAIASASEFSDERAAMLTLANTLATQRLAEMATTPAAELSALLQQAIEMLEPVVQERDRLPWSKTLAAVLRLHPSSGVKVLTRWDERGVLELDVGIRETVRALHDVGSLNDLEALHLLRLAGETSAVMSLGLMALDAARARGPQGRAAVVKAIKWLASFIEMALPVDDRLAAATRFSTWLEHHSLTSFDGADRMLAIRDLAQGLAGESTVESPTSRDWLQESDERSQRKATVTALVDAASQDGVEELRERLAALRMSLASDEEVAAYLTAVLAALPVRDRVPALNALISIPSDSDEWRWYSRAVGVAISTRTPTWRNAAVRNWLESEYPRFVGERLPSLLGYDTADLLDAIAGDPSDREHLAVAGIAIHLEAVGSDRLMALAVHLAGDLPQIDQEQTFLWALSQITDGRAESRPGSERRRSVSPPNSDPTRNAILPDLCWHLLGHPDRRVRWRVAHMCVDRAAVDSEFVDQIFARFDDHSSCGYYDDSTEFFWMSAQVWWLVAVRRIARTVALTEGQVNRLRAVVDNRGWPHALLRELARRTLLDLDPRDPVALSNQPLSCEVKRRHVYGASDPSSSTRFRFDWMDAVPYWYHEITQIFDRTMDDFLRRADAWVVDELCFDNESVLSADISMRKRYEYAKFDKRHGSEPVCEDLSTYLEWHAQFLVAGELADGGTPVVVGDYEDSPDPWHGWMAQFLSPTGGWWISDLRDPTPIEARFHQPTPSKSTWRERNDADFDRELFTDDGLVVDSYLEVSYGSLHENCWVNSALVTPEAALALLLACTTTSQPHNWVLPEADSHRDNAIEEPGFRLVGWIAARERESTGIEKHDPLRRIDLGHSVPDSTFRSDDQHPPTVEALWTLKDARSRLIKWSDATDEERGERSRYSEGRRTIVGIDQVLSHLQSTGLDLLLEVTIKRHYESDSYGRDDDQEFEHYDRGATRIYILRRDGVLVDGVGRHSQIGPGNRLAVVD